MRELFNWVKSIPIGNNEKRLLLEVEDTGKLKYVTKHKKDTPPYCLLADFILYCLLKKLADIYNVEVEKNDKSENYKEKLDYIITIYKKFGGSQGKESVKGRLIAPILQEFARVGQGEGKINAKEGNRGRKTKKQLSRFLRHKR